VSQEPSFVVIPAGDALLDDPVRTVHVNVFAIARAPVTNAEFEEFVGAASHTASTWRKGPASHPAEGLSWADAVAYCRWLSVSTGRIYRLPDEREWEKAARGAQGRKWPWGNDDDLTRANVREAGRRGTCAVGEFTSGASPEGLVDLIGNVREWTNTGPMDASCAAGRIWTSWLIALPISVFVQLMSCLDMAFASSEG